MGRTLLSASKDVSFVNAGTTPVTVGRSGNAAAGPCNAGTARVYSLDGRIVGVLKNATGTKDLRLGKGVYFLMTENNRPGKIVRFTIQ
jgi:hypothetical protein